MVSGFWIASTDIVLRDWRPDDLPAYAYWLEPGHEWKKLDAPYYPAPDPAEIPEYVERKQRIIGGAALPVPRTNVVIARADSNELIGAVSAYWESIETLWLTLGIVVYDPRYWGHGVGFTALGLWVEYQFRSRPEIVRLDLRTWSGNRGMIRLAQKLGFQQEACFRRARIVAGQHYDSLAYGILREEWEREYPNGFVPA